MIEDSLIPTDRGLLRLADLARDQAIDGLAILVDRRASAGSYAIREGTSGWRVGPPVIGTYATALAGVVAAGARETIKVITECGFTIGCAPDLRIMTTEGWVPAGRLRENRHSLLIQSGAGQFPMLRRLPFDPPVEVTGPSGKTRRYQFPTEWSADLGFVLGWLSAAGWIRGGDKYSQIRFDFSNSQLDALARIKKAVNSWYGAAVREARRPSGGYSLTYHGRTIVEFLAEFGLAGISPEERSIPEAIFQAPRDAVAGYLQGLFGAPAAQPTAQLTGPGRPGAKLAHRSRTLLQQAQLLLLNLGILAKLSDGRRGPRILFSHGTTDLRGNRETKPLYELVVSLASLEAFAREVGPVARAVPQSSRRWAPSTRKVRGPGDSPVPVYVDDVIAVRPNGLVPVYEVVEPGTSSYIANGIVVQGRAAI